MSEFKKNYFEFLYNEINRILSMKEKNIICKDILDTPFIIERKLNALKLKQFQMKVGNIWQIALGNYKECINLK